MSPAPLAADRRSADWRDVPGHTDPLTSKLASTIGGPVGRHALIGRTRFFTPMRVILLLAVVFLALGWFTKAGCIQQAPVGADGALGWTGAATASTSRCVTPTPSRCTVPSTSTRARSPTRSGGRNRDPTARSSSGTWSTGAVGLYQYGSMVVAKAWDATPWLPGGLQVAIYFNVVAFGLAMAWLVTVWASALLAGRRVWDAALVACSPLVIVHAFTNFDPLATAFAMGGLLAWARKRPVLAGILLGLGGAAKLFPLMLLGPLLVCVCGPDGCATGARDARGGRRVAGGESADRAAVPAWLGRVLPAQLRTRRRSRLDLQRHRVVHRMDRIRRTARRRVSRRPC